MPPAAAPPSNNLWIGNLATEVTESELQSVFSKYGLIDSITSYASRSFAFIYYKTIDDAKSAKDALQAHVLRGNPIRIEFAKLAKPCKSLWVAGISPSVSKEELEAEFQKFGEIQEFKFLRDRNTAYVDYFKLEDASQALKSMNGKRIGGGLIRVDFLRSQPTRREPWSDNRDAREGNFSGRGFSAPEAHWMSPDVMRNYSEPVHAGSKRHLFPPPGGRRGDGQPSNILWISYPPTVHIEEDMLHNTMILFGEIEKIKIFPDRNYSFVEFRSVDEARLAKEGLQGKLFNDPRIMIDYSSSDFGPGKEAGYYPGIQGPRPDVYFGEHPFGSRQMEMLGPNHQGLQNNVPPHIHGRGARGRDMVMRPLGPHGGVDHGIPASDLCELTTFRNLPENSPQGLHGSSDRRNSSPAGSRTPSKSGSSGWDAYDSSQVQGESKRSRMGAGMDEQYGILGNGGASGSLANPRGKNHFSPVEARGVTGGNRQRFSDDHIWRGFIAKGGTPVCQARCVPFREDGVEFNIPEVVNCSARTGLDMLAKHYADSVGFNIVFFLPDSEEDFASYTEFLRYLGSKNRAGVAKCDDGTTLFLVPPSDFLTDVLNVVGPERLYGVVLKFRPHTPSDSSSMQPHSLSSHYVDQQYVASSQTGHKGVPQERILQTNYTRVPHEDTNPPSGTPGPLLTNSLPGNTVPPISSALMQQTGVSLTPELIATLASLLPANNKTSGSENVSLPSASSTMASALSIDKGFSQGWKQEHHTQEQTGHLVQQPMTNQYTPQGQHVSQVPAYPLDSNTGNYSIHGLIGGSQTQDGTFGLHPQHAVSSKPFSSSSYLQSGQAVYPHQVDQQYQQVVPQDAQKVHRVAHGSDALSYGSSGVLQSTNSIALPNQAHGAHVVPRQSAMQLNPEMGLANQAHQHQSGQAPLQPGQATSEGEGDKNERYRTTLLFAANLLSKIQQQPGAHNGQGSGSH
ncbi:RNA metabolism protein [Lithospermum erythrorhizon]|uniref:RNA metabolism protein n=1 Tax=Lithospermum erythrorhizon TaxID=34254 RepID=A0AAV3QK68_LITER